MDIGPLGVWKEKRGTFIKGRMLDMIGGQMPLAKYLQQFLGPHCRFIHSNQLHFSTWEIVVLNVHQQ
jgi:hypothetical protein